MIKERDDKDRATEGYISSDLEIKTSKTYSPFLFFSPKRHISLFLLHKYVLSVFLSKKRNKSFLSKRKICFSVFLSKKKICSFCLSV